MTIKYCVDVWNKNKDWIFKDIEIYIEDVEIIELWFNSYKSLSGKHSLTKFKENMKFFNSIIPGAYCFDGDKGNTGEYWKNRDEAFSCLIGYLKSVKEAQLYFMAVDKITCLS